MRLTSCSAKELEHFERIRQTFESVDKKQEAGNPGSQTIAEAMEAFNLGAASPSPLSPVGTPTTNGDGSLVGSLHGRIKGLKQWPGGIVRSTSGQSTTSSKGKGKGIAGKKGKGIPAGGDSDASLEGDDEEMMDGRVEDEDEEDYIVRTEHLANPMEEVE